MKQFFAQFYFSIKLLEILELAIFEAIKPSTEIVRITTNKLNHLNSTGYARFGIISKKPNCFCNNTAIVPIVCFSNSEDCATGDDVVDSYFRVPAELNGWDLVNVTGSNGTAGTTGTMDVQIHNVTQAADMLSTKLTIDSGETDSSTAATPAVIDTANDDVATGDQIRIDVDAVHTTPAQGLVVNLHFRAP